MQWLCRKNDRYFFAQFVAAIFFKKSYGSLTICILLATSVA
jgi:hypothetical protein